jgi:hypothetical protein
VVKYCGPLLLDLVVSLRLNGKREARGWKKGGKGRTMSATRLLRLLWLARGRWLRRGLDRIWYKWAEETRGQQRMGWNRSEKDDEGRKKSQ